MIILISFYPYIRQQPILISFLQSLDVSSTTFHEQIRTNFGLQGRAYIEFGDEQSVQYLERMFWMVSYTQRHCIEVEGLYFSLWMVLDWLAYFNCKGVAPATQLIATCKIYRNPSSANKWLLGFYAIHWCSGRRRYFPAKLHLKSWVKLYLGESISGTEPCRNSSLQGTLSCWMARSFEADSWRPGLRLAVLSTKCWINTVAGRHWKTVEGWVWLAHG